jgi:hypothetical protein
VDRHDRVALVVLTRQQRADVELLEGLPQSRDPGDDLLLDGLVAFGLRELVEDLQVVEASREVVDLLDVVVEPRQVREQLAGGVGVVPEIGGRGPFAELVRLQTFRVYVKDRPWPPRGRLPRPRAPACGRLASRAL